MTDIPALSFFVFPALALAASLWLTAAIRKLAIKIDFVDRPGGRKQHSGAVPYGGGIAVFAVFTLLSLITPMPFANGWAFFLSLFMILGAGVVDDKRGIDAKVKFAIHFLAAFILVIAGKTQLMTLGNLLGFGDIMLGYAMIPFSVACIVYIINAINMMDGLDGLAGGKSLIVFGWLAIACISGGRNDVLLSLLILIASIAGFLAYNMRTPIRTRASIFLGDAGSMALGLTIAWYAIHLSQNPDRIMAPVSVAWIIALPIIDAFGLLVARLKEKRHPFDPDRRHFHHHFLEAGFSVGKATALILIWGFLLGAVGYFGMAAGIDEPVLGWLWIALWLGHTVLTVYPRSFISLLAKIRR